MKNIFAIIVLLMLLPLTAYAAPPSTPIVGGTSKMFVGYTTQNFVMSIDPENQNIIYEVDWDGNGTVDGTSLSAMSGVHTIIGNTYSSSNNYTLKVRAKDSDNQVSAWSQGFIITVNSSCNFDGSDNPQIRIYGEKIIGIPVEFGITYCLGSTFYPQVGNLQYDFNLDDLPDSYELGNVTWMTTFTNSGGQRMFYKSVRKTFNTAGANSMRARILDSANASPWAVYPDFFDGNLGLFTVISSINGTCGTSNGITTSVAPVVNLCTSGNSSPVTGSGPWNWGCYGNNATINSCNASIISTYNCEASQFNPGLSIINTFAALFRRLDPGQRIFNSNLTNKCYANTSGVSYFVPFKTTAEINAFNNNLPPGVTKSNGAW
jgi:hypothetical protein